MGSKLRRLRVQAGVTGLAQQKREREAYRLRERARKAERARLEFQDGNVIVSTNSPGGQLSGSEELHAKLEAAALSSQALSPLATEFAFHKIRLEELRVQLAHVLGSHDGAEELADGIHLAAVARAQASAGENTEVIRGIWEQALTELRRGVPPTELSALRHPGSEAEAAELVPHVPEPAMRAPGRRMPPMSTLLCLAMMGALSAPPKGAR